MTNRFIVKAPVDMALGERAEVDQDPTSRINGRPRIAVVDVIVLEVPRSDISRLSGVYFFTPDLFDAVQREGLTGLRERDHTLSFDRQATRLGQFDGLELPDFRCVEVTGYWAIDDFAHIEGRPGLIVSSAALSVLQKFNLAGVRVEPL